MLHSGSHHNDVWFSEEDEEVNDGCRGVCLDFFVTIESNGGSYNIDVLGDRHAEQILMRICLKVLCLFVKVLIQLPYSILFI